MSTRTRVARSTKRHLKTTLLWLFMVSWLPEIEHLPTPGYSLQRLQSKVPLPSTHPHRICASIAARAVLDGPVPYIMSLSKVSLVSSCKTPSEVQLVPTRYERKGFQTRLVCSRISRMPCKNIRKESSEVDVPWMRLSRFRDGVCAGSGLLREHSTTETSGCASTRLLAAPHASRPY